MEDIDFNELRKNVNNILRQEIVKGKSIESLGQTAVKEIDNWSSPLLDDRDSIFYVDPRLPLWQKFFSRFAATNDSINWLFGRWINPGWDEPLPKVLRIDKDFRETFRGIPFLYVWRLNVLDAATAVPMGIMRAEGKAAVALAGMLKDFGFSSALTFGISEFGGPPRAIDEEDDGGPRSILMYLSKLKLRNLGYTKLEGVSPITYVRDYEHVGGKVNDGVDN